jgi:transcriptional regulator with GAF, ATPase, and Fis domain
MMRTEPEILQVWLHSFSSNDGLPPDMVTSCLNQIGIATTTLCPDKMQGPGIVILKDITPEICEFVRNASRNGKERILVLASQEAPLAGGDAWRVLQAGASDVLVWNELSDPGSAIATRFRRWCDIDKLVKSPLVRKNVIGESPVWKTVMHRTIEVARFTSSPILLMGETGTGKELVARLIHTLDPQRNKGELVVLDCSTIVPELSGSELFGHERGAFTGAVAARDGAFALANGGTLFLDEVGELPLGLQTQLLRVLQERTYKRVGSNTWRSTDFRLICATNRDLRLEEAQGNFRRDLYYRIAAWSITLPPLRERIEDIIPLEYRFMQQACPEGPLPELDERVKEYFLARDYPGNVRDLRNLVNRIMTSYAGGGLITIGHIPPDERPDLSLGLQNWCPPIVAQAIHQAITLGLSLREIRHAIEEMAIQIAVEHEDGNLQRAAHRLGVTDRTLQKRRAAEYRQIQSMMDGKTNWRPVVVASGSENGASDC